LDERGVEWESGLPTETIVREPNDALYVERPDGRMHVYFRSYLTPEQAIAATLGPCSDSCNCTNGERTGTCHVESSIIDTYEYNRWEYELSCGHTIIWEDSEPPRYCPECERRIVQ
jgi:hypothetical protein